MNMLRVLGPILGKVLGVVDQVVDDGDQAAKIKAALSTQILSQESDFVEAASRVITAEAQGESWLQRNWRPLIMVFFAFLIGAYWFGFVPVNMEPVFVESILTTVQYGIGGYVVGRSGEKIAKVLSPTLGR